MFNLSPKIGVSTRYLLNHKENFLKIFDLLSEPGFREEKSDILEIVDSEEHYLDKEKIKRLNEFMKTGSIFTIHCPCDDWINIADKEVSRRKRSIRRIIESIDAAASLEAKSFVLHPGNYYLEEKDSISELNGDSLIELSDYASDRGIPIGVENMMVGSHNFMKLPEEFKSLEERRGIKINLTLDVGHAQIGNQIENFIDLYADRILSIHIHDNGGSSDDHLDIGEGVIEWKQVLKKIVTSSFSGNYIVETHNEPFDSLLTLRKMLSELEGSYSNRGKVILAP